LLKKRFGFVKRFVESKVESESPSKYLKDSDSTKSLKLLIRPFTKLHCTKEYKDNKGSAISCLYSIAG
jgi:hypothetical protein